MNLVKYPKFFHSLMSKQIGFDYLTGSSSMTCKNIPKSFSLTLNSLPFVKSTMIVKRFVFFP